MQNKLNSIQLNNLNNIHNKMNKNNEFDEEKKEEMINIIEQEDIEDNNNKTVNYNNNINNVEDTKYMNQQEINQVEDKEVEKEEEEEDTILIKNKENIKENYEEINKNLNLNNDNDDNDNDNNDYILPSFLQISFKKIIVRVENGTKSLNLLINILKDYYDIKKKDIFYYTQVSHTDIYLNEITNSSTERVLGYLKNYYTDLAKIHTNNADELKNSIIIELEYLKTRRVDVINHYKYALQQVKTNYLNLDTTYNKLKKTFIKLSIDYKKYYEKIYLLNNLIEDKNKLLNINSSLNASINSAPSNSSNSNLSTSPSTSPTFSSMNNYSSSSTKSFSISKFMSAFESTPEQEKEKNEKKLEKKKLEINLTYNKLIEVKNNMIKIKIEYENIVERASLAYQDTERERMFILKMILKKFVESEKHLMESKLASLKQLEDIINDHHPEEDMLLYILKMKDSDSLFHKSGNTILLMEEFARSLKESALNDNLNENNGNLLENNNNLNDYNENLSQELLFKQEFINDCNEFLNINNNFHLKSETDTDEDLIYRQSFSYFDQLFLKEKEDKKEKEKIKDNLSDERIDSDYDMLVEDDTIPQTERDTLFQSPELLTSDDNDINALEETNLTNSSNYNSTINTSSSTTISNNLHSNLTEILTYIFDKSNEEIKIESKNVQDLNLVDDLTDETYDWKLLLSTKALRDYFLQVLDEKRSSVSLISTSLFSSLSTALFLLLNYCDETEDNLSAMRVLNMGNTFYKLSLISNYDENDKSYSKDTRKIYLSETLSLHAIYKKENFWEETLKKKLFSELKKYFFNYNDYLSFSYWNLLKSDELKEKISSLHNILFGILTSFLFSMLQNGLNKKNIIKKIEFLSKKFELSEEQQYELIVSITNRKVKEYHPPEFIPTFSSDKNLKFYYLPPKYYYQDKLIERN